MTIVWQYSLAKLAFMEVSLLDAMHWGAKIHLDMIDRIDEFGDYLNGDIRNPDIKIYKV